MHIKKALKAATHGGPSFLQEHGLDVDQLPERPGDVHERLAGADPVALGKAELDLELDVTRPGDLFQPVERELRRAQHGAAHEHGVGPVDVAEPLHDLAGLDEVLVREPRQLVRGRSHGEGSSSAPSTAPNYVLPPTVASRTHGTWPCAAPVFTRVHAGCAPRPGARRLGLA